jgi:hypothetical protein
MCGCHRLDSVCSDSCTDESNRLFILQPHLHYLQGYVLQAPVWRVSWSITGGILAVSDSQGNVTLWKKALNGEWQQLAS